MSKDEFKQGYLTEMYPLLAKQFDEKKNQMKAETIYITTLYDERPFHWKCPCCHSERETTIYSRLKNPTAWLQLKCGQCIKGLSYPQLAIRIHFENVIKQTFPNATVTSAVYEGFEIDIVIAIPEINKLFSIEYDSEYYHRHRIDFDKLKNTKVIKKRNLVRVREEGLPSLEDDHVKEICSPRFPRKDLNMFDIAVKNCFQYFIEFLKVYSTLNKKELQTKIEKINELTKWIDTKTIEKEIYNRLSEVPFEKRLSTVAPQLAKQFSAKNEIDVEKVSAYSNVAMLWECLINEEHKLEPFPAAVNARTIEYLKAVKERREYNGCPYCAGKSAVKSESLKTLYPEVTEYLEYGIELYQKDMEIDFFKIPVNSIKKLPFSCRKCHYAQPKREWRTVQSLIKIYDNIQNGTSKFKSLCPHCHENDMLTEGETYFNLLKNGNTPSNIAYTYNTSIKRVRKLINEYERMKGLG